MADSSIYSKQNLFCFILRVAKNLQNIQLSHLPAPVNIYGASAIQKTYYYYYYYYYEWKESLY